MTVWRTSGILLGRSFSVFPSRLRTVRGSGPIRTRSRLALVLREGRSIGTAPLLVHAHSMGDGEVAGTSGAFASTWWPSTVPLFTRDAPARDAAALPGPTTCGAGRLFLYRQPERLSRRLFDDHLTISLLGLFFRGFTVAHVGPCSRASHSPEASGALPGRPPRH